MKKYEKVFVECGVRSEFMPRILKII